MPAIPSSPQDSPRHANLTALFPQWGRHLKQSAPEPFCDLAVHVALQHTSDLKSMWMESPSIATLRLALGEQGVFAPECRVDRKALSVDQCEEVNPVWLEAHFKPGKVPLSWQVRWFTLKAGRVIKLSASLGLGKVPAVYGVRLQYDKSGKPVLYTGFTRAPGDAKTYPQQWTPLERARVLRCWWSRQAAEANTPSRVGSAAR